MDILLSALEILWQYRPAFLSGLFVTLKLCLIVWTAGIFGGSFLGWYGALFPRMVGCPIRFLAFILSGIPVLVFLFWLHYPAQAMYGVVIDPFYTAAFTFSIVNLFSVSELIRVQIVEFPQQYLIAARVCGLSARQTAFRIQLPILLRQVIPPMLVLQVGMLHLTLFASLISVDEIFRTAQRINASLYRPIEIYTALAIFFLAVGLPLNALAGWLRALFTRNLSEK